MTRHRLVLAALLGLVVVGLLVPEVPQDNYYSNFTEDLNCSVDPCVRTELPYRQFGPVFVWHNDDPEWCPEGWDQYEYSSPLASLRLSVICGHWSLSRLSVEARLGWRPTRPDANYLSYLRWGDMATWIGYRASDETGLIFEVSRHTPDESWMWNPEYADFTSFSISVQPREITGWDIFQDGVYACVLVVGDLPRNYSRHAWCATPEDYP